MKSCVHFNSRLHDHAALSYLPAACHSKGAVFSKATAGSVPNTQARSYPLSKPEARGRVKLVGAPVRQPLSQEETSEVHAESAVSTSVARVQCTVDVPRFDMPLLLGAFRTVTCQAVAVRYQERSYLLTCASAVAYGSQIRVWLPGALKPLKARVVALGVECDLAALEPVEPVAASSSDGETSFSNGSSSSFGRGTAEAAGMNASAEEAEGSEAGYSTEEGGMEQSEGSVQSLWSQLTPLELGDLPALTTPLQLLACEEGQDQARSVRGAVSSVGISSYPTALQRLLALQISIASGRIKFAQGMPVLDAAGKALLGIVFRQVALSSGPTRAQTKGSSGSGSGGGAPRAPHVAAGGATRKRRRRAAELAMMAAPASVIRHFLEDLHTQGRYMGFPTLGIRWKRTESPALRKYLAMQDHHTGVFILDVNPTSLAAGHLLPGDVLLALGDTRVANDGTVAFRNGEAINIAHHLSQMQVGEVLELSLLRGGQEVHERITLGVPHTVVPMHLAGQPPQYMVVSGLVLTSLSVPYLEGAFGRRWSRLAPVSLLRALQDQPTGPGQQVVVCAELQDMPATDGYDPAGMRHQIVTHVDGQRVSNMREMATIVLQRLQAYQTATSGSGVGFGAPRPSGKGQRSSKPASASAAGSERQADGAELVSGSGQGDDYIRFSMGNSSMLLLPLEDVQSDTRQMLLEYEVEHPVSADLRDLLLLPSKKGAAARRGAKRS